MINVAEKLKGCPKGTKLYSPLFGEVELVRIDMGNHRFSIIVKVSDDESPYSIVTFTDTGKWYDIKQCECLLFPSKDNRDWNKFDYRIKPEYRPFANARECWEEMQKHQPFGWVKCKDGSTTNKFMFICDISDKDATFNNCIEFTYDDFLEDYVFADGTPFGVKIEEDKQ